MRWPNDPQDEDQNAPEPEELDPDAGLDAALDAQEERAEERDLNVEFGGVNYP